MVGKTISHYKILEKLGEGGMGVVYKAEDTQLKRKVALKFLTPQALGSEEEKTRFVHEAQAAAALDHPNICTVYEIGEADGHAFIAMAHVEGQNLRDKMEAEQIELEDALHIATQVAEGLQEAHEKGIVHRDIKPANIMVNPKGQVKIMDFGLAKLSGRTKLTKSGTTMGTVAYMSPEQARNEQVDHCSDIFSFGAVLYELCSGRQPFEGDYEAAILYSLAHEEPKPLPDEVPEELQRVVFKCLEKQTDERYESAERMLAALQELERETDSSTQPAEIQRKQKSGNRTMVVLAGAAIIFLAFIAAQLGGLFEPDRTVLSLSNPRQITSAIGVEDHPTWSSDGGRLAYESRQSGNWDIWIKQIASGEPVNRTAGYSGSDRWPTWSPDGNQIAFKSNRDGEGYYIMPAIGGPAHKVSQSNDRSKAGQWSPDGTKLAFTVFDSLNAYAEIRVLRTGQTQRIPLPGSQLTRDALNWSPDSRNLVYVDTSYPYPRRRESSITAVRIADSTSWRITGLHHFDYDPKWSSDGRTLYFISDRGGIMDMWQIALDGKGRPTGKPLQVTTGIGLRSVAFSPDGKKLAYSKGRLVANLWRAPIPEPGAPPITWTDAQRLTSDNAYIENIDVSPDGKRIFFDSDRAGGNSQLWVMQVESGELQQLTTGPMGHWAPELSPDGGTIAFKFVGTSATGSGVDEDIWVMPSTGGQARQLTTHKSADFPPQWAPDGKAIAFSSGRSGQQNIWVMPEQGGDARQITGLGTGYAPLWWPDGEWLSFITWYPDYRIWRTPLAGGNPKPLTQGTPLLLGGEMRWSADFKQIYFSKMIDEASTRNIWSLDIEAGYEKQLTDLKGRDGDMGYRALATDGKYFYFTWEEETGDIWVMDVEQED